MRGENEEISENKGKMKEDTECGRLQRWNEETNAVTKHHQEVNNTHQYSSCRHPAVFNCSECQTAELWSWRLMYYLQV